MQPARGTTLQPYITPAFLTQLNPILLAAVTTGLASLDLSTFQTVRNPVQRGAALDINMTRLRIYDVEWGPGSGLTFGEGVVKLNASLSSKVDVSYFTNSRYRVSSFLVLEFNI
jgi:hypothetical protein